MLRYQQQFSFFDPAKVADGSIRFVNLTNLALENNLDRMLEHRDLQRLVSVAERVNVKAQRGSESAEDLPDRRFIVRELKNVLERACMLTTGQFIDEGDLASRSAGAELEEPSPRSTALVPLITTVEKTEILRALEATGGNKNQAARQLGISRRALYRRLERLGLDG
jgi:transcriptional regulator with GAF, ATPase, and Fis domain